MMMSNPLEATRTAPVSTTIRDCLVQAWVTSNASAPSSGSAWTIDVGGHEVAGPAVDRGKHASMDGVKDMLRQWAKEHPALFD
jgi:hypothetical protein